ncbi:unnamed protein product [Phytophthora fragariaefolia]|uniref:hydroxymethylglutaryl-CoA lyase n=1 Tax=Phytophthora fragariaefolia TaxID=1490495 RepID=A0A9W6Y6V6_9STRA|nr:unnamed protein product [Phytophthora fragariaefolia]
MTGLRRELDMGNACRVSIVPWRLEPRRWPSLERRPRLSVRRTSTARSRRAWSASDLSVKRPAGLGSVFVGEMICALNSVDVNIVLITCSLNYSYVSCVLGCPYQGPVEPSIVAEVALKMLEIGCYEVIYTGYAESYEAGRPGRASRCALPQYIRTGAVEHPHRAAGTSYPSSHSTSTATDSWCYPLQEGVAVVDSSVAGLGGCPYASGASGNVATEDVLYMVHGLGIQTGVDLHKVMAAGEFITNLLGHSTHSKVAQALGPKARNASRL